MKKCSKNKVITGGYLVAKRLLFAVDPEQHSFLCVVALHLHHNVVLVGLFGAAAQETPKCHKNTPQKRQVFTSHILTWFL